MIRCCGLTCTAVLCLTRKLKELEFMNLQVALQNERRWNGFIDETYSVVRKFKFKKIPKESEKFVVMVEPREHPHLEYVLRNAMHFLGEDWGLQIFVGNKNKQFVENIVKDWNYVHVCQIHTDDLDAKAYNSLKKQPGFWDLVKGEYVLWIEPDCLLCHGNIDEFLIYDYVGAPWNSKMSLSRKVQVGNGGLSLRRKSSMIKIGSTCNRDRRIFLQEDLFFCVNMKLQKDKYRIPELDVAKKFAVESVFYPSPMGLHKSWKYLPEEQFESLISTINYIP